jgi:hypothetical protein
LRRERLRPDYHQGGWQGEGALRRPTGLGASGFTERALVGGHRSRGGRPMRLGIVLSLLCLASTGLGCPFGVVGTGSKPTDVPRDSWEPGRPLRVSLEGLELSVQIQNVKQIYFLANPIPVPLPLIRRAPLKVWINLKLQDGPFSFDPGRVFLRIDGKRRLKPIGYMGPGVGGTLHTWTHLRCGVPKTVGAGDVTERAVVYEECFNCVTSSTPSREPAQPLRIEEEACFVLLFAIRPSPKHLFALSVEGIEKDGAQVHVPEIRFERGTHSEFAGS